MAIPGKIKLKKGVLPTSPGVYLMKGIRGKILYVGKATSLKTRVSSYFGRAISGKTAAMVDQIRSIDYRETPTAIEALLLESRLIKRYLPPYNVLAKDDKSLVYLAFTNDDYPRPIMIRGHELSRMPKRGFLKVYGPFRSAASVRASLDALRKAFPWTECRPGRNRPCFHRHLALCPGVCAGEITSRDYRRIIRSLMMYFEGKQSDVVRALKQEMITAAEGERYEQAATCRDRLYALEHIRDIAVLKKEEARLDHHIDIFGRIEGYDISNISGKDAVGSMVVFTDGEPHKNQYRKFGIKTVVGSNDTAMINEVISRRFTEKDWDHPDLIVIDGGKGQLNAARKVLRGHGLEIPLVGIAKGIDRKRDELVYDKTDHELGRLIHAFKPLLLRVRDEAHRFAVAYHRNRRSKSFITSRKR